MANTNLLKTLVEPYVREWVSREYKISISSKETEIKLVSGGMHRFDVVSDDGTLVGGVKTSPLRPSSSGPTVSPGTIKSTYTELYFLSLANAKKKLMILTDRDYYKKFVRDSRGKVAGGIEIVYCPLNDQIRHKITAIHEECRREIGKRASAVST